MGEFLLSKWMGAGALPDFLFDRQFDGFDPGTLEA